MSSHYETLNVTRDAEDVVIESAYRALMKRYHPDKTNGDPIAAERAKEINAAYSTLRDAESRARYDRSLGREAPPHRPEPRPQPQAARPAEPAAGHDLSPGNRPAPRSGLVTAAFIGLALLIGVGTLGSIFGDNDVSGATKADPAATLEAGDDVTAAASQPLASRPNDEGDGRGPPTTERRQTPESIAPPVPDSDGGAKTNAVDAPLINDVSEVAQPPKDLDGLY